jgi:hypothetical protein
MLMPMPAACPAAQVCVLRSHELYPHAERLSSRYHRHRQEYHTEPAAVAEAAAAAHASALEKASAADARGEAPAEKEDRPGAAASASVTHLAEWAADPDRLSFQPPESRCILRPNGETSRGGVPLLPLAGGWGL